MGLRSALQEIIGEKIFRHNITFDKDVIFKKHITAYAPMASEPSLGTPHPKYFQFATNVTIGAGYTGTWDLTGLPTGVKMISVFGYFTSATAGNWVLLQNSAITSFGYGFVQVAGYQGGIQGLIAFNNDKIVKLLANAAVTGVNLFATLYWI